MSAHITVDGRGAEEADPRDCFQSIDQSSARQTPIATNCSMNHLFSAVDRSPVPTPVSVSATVAGRVLWLTKKLRPVILLPYSSGSCCQSMANPRFFSGLLHFKPLLTLIITESAGSIGGHWPSQPGRTPRQVQTLPPPHCWQRGITKLLIPQVKRAQGGFAGQKLPEPPDSQEFEAFERIGTGGRTRTDTPCGNRF